MKTGSPAALSDLSLEEIAAAFIMLVPSCLTLGHQSIQGTLTYVHGDRAGAFVKDVITRPPAEVARKWYGGEKYAKEVLAKAMGKALFGPEMTDQADAPGQIGEAS
jgi:hypothetical protein